MFRTVWSLAGEGTFKRFLVPDETWGRHECDSDERHWLYGRARQPVDDTFMGLWWIDILRHNVLSVVTSLSHFCKQTLLKVEEEGHEKEEEEEGDEEEGVHHRGI